MTTAAVDRDTRVTEVLRRESPDLLRFFSRRMSADDAADAVGETMVTAWRRADALPDDDLAARLWLFGVARHVLMHARRSGQRRTDLTDRLRRMTTETVAQPSDAGLEVRDALARLPERHAEILRLVHWDGFALTEAAEILGIKDSTIRSRYQRAKDALRHELAQS